VLTGYAALALSELVARDGGCGYVWQAIPLLRRQPTSTVCIYIWKKETERCVGVERSQYDIRSDTTASERLPVIGLSLPGVLACGPVIPQKVHVQESMRLWAYANRRSGGKATSK
jgi:hypothetical protein